MSGSFISTQLQPTSSLKFLRPAQSTESFRKPEAFSGQYQRRLYAAWSDSCSVTLEGGFCNLWRCQSTSSFGHHSADILDLQLVQSAKACAHLSLGRLKAHATSCIWLDHESHLKPPCGFQPPRIPLSTIQATKDSTLQELLMVKADWKLLLLHGKP